MSFSKSRRVLEFYWLDLWVRLVKENMETRIQTQITMWIWNEKCEPCSFRKHTKIPEINTQRLRNAGEANPDQLDGVSLHTGSWQGSDCSVLA